MSSARNSEGSRATGQAREGVASKFEEVKDRAGEYFEQGRRRAREWEENLEQYVQDQPVRAILMAAGIGFVIGMLWKRR
ncbi:MAG: DUF883 family protein [Tepidisphaeraceae bacterium]